ncbi:MAG: hypothetical protein POELPBGB_01933 [Bacteroidia bacterium]|nr:hypothetical protein [Bacteroidia bacterium]
MKTYWFVFLFVLAITVTYYSKADMWEDPSWKEMIDSSDVIGKFKVVNGGTKRAQLIPLKIYKGELKDTIWISGFSGRYGPYETMEKGEEYILFLNKEVLNEESKKAWENDIKKYPEWAEYYQGVLKSKAFEVWTPTSGDYYLAGDTIRYDLFQTTTYNYSGKSLNEFEEFLEFALSKKSLKEYHKQLITKIRKCINDTLCAMHPQYIMMLALTNYNHYIPLFDTLIRNTAVKARFGLATLMGNINSEKSRVLLLQLLSDSNSVVQGEAVRQLSGHDPDFVGPIFINYLNKTGEDGVYPSDIMDPVRNQLEGGKIEIIKALNKMKYKPATEALLGLLKTNNTYLFNLTIEALINIGSKEYVPYLNYHLENDTRDLIFDVCRIIVENELSECIEPLKKFISSHDRKITPDADIAISKYYGLAHFSNDEINSFLLNDFKKFIKADTLEYRIYRSWIQSYISTFSSIEAKNARPLIYESLKYWTGMDSNFVKYPELFSIKSHLEDSLKKECISLIDSSRINKLSIMAILNNTNDIIIGAKPNYNTIVILDYKFNEDAYKKDKLVFELLSEKRAMISKRFKIPLEQVYTRSGMYISCSFDRVDFEINHSPLSDLFDFIKKYPTKEDVQYLTALKESSFWINEYELKHINYVIEDIEKALKN